MGWTTAERAAELLKGVLEDTDDEEQRFKLRTALQLIEIIEEQHETANKALADCDIDRRTRAHLQKLGYLE